MPLRPIVVPPDIHHKLQARLQRDPDAEVTDIPTPHVFIIVEKTPHPFQINAWARRFSRAEVEERLLTWVYLYQGSHSNIRVFMEDEHVRVYHIERSPEEIERLSRRAEKG